jgi:hypothetical protein
LGDEETRQGPDVGQLDRVLSRSIAFLGLIALAFLWMRTGTGGVPVAAAVAFAGVYLLGKLVTGVLGIIYHWPAWPAVFAEGAAIAVVGWIVRSGSRNVIALLACVALLLGAGLWRSRIARSEQEDA